MKVYPEFFEREGGSGNICQNCKWHIVTHRQIEKRKWQEINKCLLRKCIEQPDIAKMIVVAIKKKGVSRK